MPIPDFANEAIFPAFEGLPIEDAGAADPPSYAASSEPPSYVPPPPPDPPSYSDSQSGSGSASAAAAATSLTLSDTSATSAAAAGSAVTPKPSSHDAREEWFLVAEVKQNMTITKPTLVVVDRGGTEFAVTFEDRGIDLRPVKQGWTIVVPRAVRTAPKGGKRGFVRVPEGRGTGVKYVPGGLEKIGELGARVRGGGEEGEDGGKSFRGRCAGCGTGEGEDGGALKSCTACGVARYCGKVSFPDSVGGVARPDLRRQGGIWCG
ncbi:zinc MYND-type domain containing protein [Colletotrichum tofieldiae]|uniref:Zinc MYND-type domain containing protein n=1 Tax=Colletotrichum tofieldiae TaxID=708197 RepID=A0A166VL34_9PEZI|nr:zinc MYND-type domain containing protein [Colletotrichum tofieldiae]